MGLHIYNSLTKKKEPFVPRTAGQVHMYVCGPTVYDEPHIGHLRSAYIFDVIRRYLASEYCGYEVTLVRNVTDVDDKIIDKARLTGASDLNQEVKGISQKYLDIYHEELKACGIVAPTVEPKATEHIPEMIRLIQRLMDRQMAYERDGNVYFRVSTFKDYGKLSGQKKEQMLEGARVDVNEAKEDPLDFALWKKVKQGEPSWPSPWGDGRPGWHIECSAMSMKYLKESFDIHGGGLDLIFPHHENEIAQAEGATGKPFAAYWIHHGLVTRDGQKMSKSLHNYTASLIRQLPNQKEKSAEQHKLFYLSAHYRAPLDYTDEKMRMARDVQERFNNFFYDNSSIKAQADAGSAQVKRFETDFKNAMDDDFNTPRALAVMHAMIHFACGMGTSSEIRLGIGEKLKNMGQRVFGIFCASSDQQSAQASAEEVSLNRAVSKAIEERASAKRDKNFIKADQIRAEVEKQYRLVLIDHKDGTTTWRKS